MYKGVYIVLSVATFELKMIMLGDYALLTYIFTSHLTLSLSFLMSVYMMSVYAGAVAFVGAETESHLDAHL